MTDQAIRMPCLTCGDFHDTGTEYCQEHLTSRGKVQGKVKALRLKRFGIVPESHRKRGRKAYNNRLINLAQTNPERYERLLANLEKRQPRRAGFIKGRVRRISCEVMG